jgi:hypothetical protein
MKNRGLILLVLSLILGWTMHCHAQTTKSDTKSRESVSLEKIDVYYFHFERRCATCNAVENESEKALKELYPEKIKNGEITFLSVNLEDKTNEPLAEDLSVNGQALLIVKGEQQDNLTNTAFMHARTNPDKLKKAIQESIDKLL